MTKLTRARYTLEFKEEAVRLVTGGERVATVARNLGPPVGGETIGATMDGGGERPSAFWWRMIPLKKPERQSWLSVRNA